VVYDAPLLFEAGLDSECDAVLFVEAPEAVRMARARSSRGWSEQDYAVRQAAQWPLERKRALCRFVVTNDRDGVDPDRQCAEIAAILTGGQG
jgi:dephospho-CoA kinase